MNEINDLGRRFNSGDPKPVSMDAGAELVPGQLTHEGNGITPASIAANAGLIHQILAGLQARYDMSAVVTPGKKTDIQITPKASISHDSGPLHAEISKQMGMPPSASLAMNDGNFHAFIEKQLGVPPTAGLNYTKQLGDDLSLSAGVNAQRGAKPQSNINLNYKKKF